MAQVPAVMGDPIPGPEFPWAQPEKKKKKKSFGPSTYIATKDSLPIEYNPSDP